MHKISTLSDLKNIIENQKQKNQTIGFVPTMGALHEGHLSLIKHSLNHSDFTIVSIFVNPAQFGPNEDFDSYPRSVTPDLELLQEHHVDAVFLPTTELIYPRGKDITTQLTIPELSHLYCGKSRPQFFGGILTVVIRLFNLIRPNHAYFGEKDFQQATLIKMMVTDLFLPIEIIMCPIIREENGLAMSSRNMYLSEKEQTEASQIYKALSKAKEHFESGERSVSNLMTSIRSDVTKQTTIAFDYCEVTDEVTLHPQKGTAKKGNRILFAGYLKKTRLIDNIEL